MFKCTDVSFSSNRDTRAGTLTVEQIYQDRDKFAQLVREVAAPDVGRMGIEILSFTIKVSNDGQNSLLVTTIMAENKHPRCCRSFLTGCVR